jgi:hypothetical protein
MGLSMDTVGRFVFIDSNLAADNSFTHVLQITAIRASNNNKASTVLDLFLSATEEYGFPSRLRGDRGGENMDVAVYMVMRNGTRRASFIWGT